MPMQIRRTATPNAPPTGLAEGQLGVEMAGPRPRLWIGVPTAVDPSGRRLLVPSGAVSSATAPATPETGDLWYDSTNDLLKYYDGTNWQTLVIDAPSDGTMYARQDGAWEAVPVPVPPADVSVVPVGGRLEIVGSSPAAQIRYSPYNGGWIRIDGTDYPIPAAGVISGGTNVFIDGVGGQNLVVGTMYFAYLFDNAGTLTIDYSTTGHQTSATAGNVGVEIKQADDSRTFIGLVRSDAVGFRDEMTARFVRSWINRRSISLAAFSSISVTGGVYSFGTGIISYLTFAGESQAITLFGNGNNGNTTGANFYGVEVDLSSVSQVQFTLPGPGAPTPIAMGVVDTTVSDRLRQHRPLAYTNAGTLILNAGLSALVTE